MPVCKDCEAHLATGKLPPLSYANDMWTDYGLQRIYEQNVTAIEGWAAGASVLSRAARHQNG